MKSNKIVFVHGWGLDPSFWRPVAAAFADDYDLTYVDLGFRGAASLDVPDDDAIYVTHSMGTIWALAHHADKMEHLIPINGFMDFPLKKALPAMRRALDLPAFFQAADIVADATGLLPDALAEGLDFIAAHNMMRDYDFPITALAGALDAIVPIKAAQQQFSNIRIHPMGGHGLPQSHSDWCIQQIKDILA